MKVKIIALLLSLVVLSQCQQPPSPNDEQLECFNETTTIEVNEFHRVCGDVLFGPPLTDPDDICDTGDCFLFLYRVYSDCGYDGLDTVCGAPPVSTTPTSSTPTTPTSSTLDRSITTDDGSNIFTGILDMPALPVEVEECIALEARRLQLGTTCKNLDSDKLTDFCSSGECRQVSEEVLELCNFSVANSLCDGAIKVYAVPLLILISVSLSVHLNTF